MSDCWQQPSTALWVLRTVVNYNSAFLCHINGNILFNIIQQFNEETVVGPRSRKRMRGSDAIDIESRLESLITRVGEKVCIENMAVCI